jgi:CHAT domain-containing protein
MASSGPPPPFDESPLLRSGLALAGFNRHRHAGEDEEDGVLTAEEIAALDLGRVRCAVLSACETGVGDPAAGEGVFGLRRAFRVAGVSSLVTSLWRVDDLASRNWMARFYERLMARASPSVAATDASRAMLAQARASGGDTHPSTWGAFVAIGGR